MHPKDEKENTFISYSFIRNNPPRFYSVFNSSWLKDEFCFYYVYFYLASWAKEKKFILPYVESSKSSRWRRRFDSNFSQVNAIILRTWLMAKVINYIDITLTDDDTSFLSGCVFVCKLNSRIAFYCCRQDSISRNLKCCFDRENVEKGFIFSSHLASTVQRDWLTYCL